MPVYFEYALKVSLCLAIVFIFYSLLLRRITYYTWNRYFLLIFSAFSFIIPFINVNVFFGVQQINTIPFVSRFPVIGDKMIPLNLDDINKTFNYWQILAVTYLLVSSTFFIRLLIQLASIKKISTKATLTVADGLRIYYLAEPVLPFSFLNSVYINKNIYSEKELQEIIDHERVHVQQKHTYDMLIAEIICIVNWYNPFTWLIKNAVRENLEFIADDAVVKKGVNRKNYQYLLLKVTGDVPCSIASNFKFSSLKNRILMMNKTKTGRIHLLKFALIVPLATILLLAFRNKQNIDFRAAAPAEKTYILSSLTYSIPDKNVEALIKKEKNECLLKTGELLSLDLVFNEKARLKDLLERNGFNEIESHEITFMIDTAQGNNSFSVQINIDLTRDKLSKTKEDISQVKSLTSAIDAYHSNIEPASQKYKSDASKYINKNDLSKKQTISDKKISGIQ